MTPALPVEDRMLSPFTGWTRGHWTALLDATLAAARRHASPGHALINPPGPASVSGRRSDGLEGFARTFLAVGFRAAGGEVDGGVLEWYAEGLAAGVDPASPERWPLVTEISQAKVEAASIALALHESRHLLWDNLPDRVREQTVDWLAGVIGADYPACNWLWFQNVVEAFLRSVGGPWSAEDVERNIEQTETWYLGDGWYTDGYAGVDTPRNFDWYAGWAMNFYPLWYCRIASSGSPLWTRYRDRLHAYLDGAQHLFAPDGPPLHQGRSLTYRYAAVAPLWAGAIFDATPLPPGRTRRLASGVLRHFHRAGAWNDDGLHPIGWYGDFSPIRQPYSGPGSPYWSCKGFAGLVLPPDHPVWTDVERPAEVEERDVSRTLAVPGWIVSGTRADGVIRVVNHGTDHQPDGVPGRDDPGYSRLAYSTHAGPEYGPDALQSPVDNHVALLDEHGTASHRRPLQPVHLNGRVAVSRHRAHWPTEPYRAVFTWPPPPDPPFRNGPWLTTASVLRGPIEIRLVRLDPPPADHEVVVGTEQAKAGRHAHHLCMIGGWAVAGGEAPSVVVEGRRVTVARGDGLCSVVVGLGGVFEAGVNISTGTNAFGLHSAIPWVRSTAPAVPGRVYAAAVILTATALGPLPEVSVTGDTVHVRWPDGKTDTVDLGASP